MKHPFFEGEQTILIDGPAGDIECIAGSPRGEDRQITAIVCHPHPQMGGTMDNKVVHTIARAFRDLGCRTVRFNFRGVGASQGAYDAAVGEIDDLMSVVEWVHNAYPNAPLVLAGFSFGSFVAANGLARCLEKNFDVLQLVLVAPPVDRMGFDQLPPLHIPTLVIQGDDDEVVSADSVVEWVEQRSIKFQPDTPATLNKTTLVRLPVSGHFFHGKLTELKKIISDNVF